MAPRYPSARNKRCSHDDDALDSDFCTHWEGGSIYRVIRYVCFVALCLYCINFFSLTLREGYELRMLENRVLRVICER